MLQLLTIKVEKWKKQINQPMDEINVPITLSALTDGDQSINQPVNQ